MSGAEFFLAVLGVVGPALQAFITARGHTETSIRSRAHARSIAELHNEIGRDQFKNIYLILHRYEQVVESNIPEEDRLVASRLRNNIYRIIKLSEETVQELYNASRDERSIPENITAIESRLGYYGQLLNNALLSLQFHLSLQNFPRLGPDGRVALLQIPTERSDILSTTLRSSIEPTRVSYDNDPQLEWPVHRGDKDLLKNLFDPQEDATEPTSRPSLALLLACRKGVPAVVKLSLDYGADPTVTGDDGLGAIHNAIGTADVEGESRKILEILHMLINRGVEPSARDWTTEQLRPLHRAAKTKNISATKLLLEKDPDMVNLVDADGRTALYHACSTPNQKMPLIKDLVNHGADFAHMSRPRMPDVDGQQISRFLDRNGLS